MVWVKKTPKHAIVRPLKCIIAAIWYVLWYSIIMNYFWETSRHEKKEIWQTTSRMSTAHQRRIQLPLWPRKLQKANVTRLQWFIIGGDSFQEHVEALISYNVRNNGQQQDCLYIKQGHLMTLTSFMTHSMAIDPRRTIAVSWMPISYSTLLLESQHWCPLGLQSSTLS